MTCSTFVCQFSWKLESIKGVFQFFTQDLTHTWLKAKNQNCVESSVKKVIKIECQSDFILPGFFKQEIYVELMQVNWIYIFCLFFKVVIRTVHKCQSKRSSRLKTFSFLSPRILKYGIDANSFVSIEVLQKNPKNITIKICGKYGF